jgi:surfeit locus 1 family protein
MRDRRKAARLLREEQASLDSKNASKRHWHKPSVIAWLMVTASTLLLFSLTAWQLNRLEWKTGLIAQINNYAHQRALTAMPEDTSLLKDFAFARVALSGTFLHEDEIHLAARYYNSQLGYHILTPLQLADGSLVLINRGWVHVDYKDPAKRQAGQVQGVQHIIGMIRLDNDRSFFTPENNPKTNIWFSRNIDDIIKATNLDLYPAVVDALYDIPEGNMPIPSDGLIMMRNDHLQYALTWFLIGVSGIMTFIFYHYRKNENAEDDTTP